MIPGLAVFVTAAASGASVALFDHTDDETAIVGNDAGTFYQLMGTGYINVSSGGGLGTSILGQWLLSGSVSDYEARMTVLSGAFTDGPVGSWGDPAHMWRVDRSALGISRARGRLELRRVSDAAVVAAAIVDLTSRVISGA